MDIKIEPEFESIIPALTKQEYELLEKSIIAEGCREALIVWAGEDILLDGHNRYAICRKHKIEYKTILKQFDTEDDAKSWVIDNQLGRRNLKPDQFTLLLGMRFKLEKKTHVEAGAMKGKSKVQNEPSLTAEVIGKQHGVSASTVKRAEKTVDVVERIKVESPAMFKEIKDGTKTIAQAVRETKRVEVIAKLEDVKVKEVKKLAGLYDVVVIDPPWAMEKIERDVRPNQSEFDYPTMNEDELNKFKIPASEDCHLWLWTTHRFLPMAFRLLETWHFKYVCCFVWHKPGGFQVVGLPQYNAEFSLYARKGNPIFVDTKAFNVCFNAPRGSHSEKPEEFYEVIRRVTKGRRIDIFNRRKIEGFDGWGQEAK
jgi:N6-adenosine-specific RNA methylase IME4